jgi:CheY-like chemotaxis protein
MAKRPAKRRKTGRKTKTDKGAKKSVKQRLKKPLRKTRARAPARPGRAISAPSLRQIEQTLAELAHEIRTPLTGIVALGELLAAAELGERERGWASAIKSTGEHLATLTSLIVDAGRAGAKGLVLRREPFAPRQLADVLATSLAARGEAKELKVAVDIADDLPAEVIGDELRLRAALENLIDNALKFTERGEVRLQVTSEQAAPGHVRLVFAVTDSGIGITAAEIKRLFRPFAQASEKVARQYGGAGLGLAFVRRIAKAMRGDLTVSSRPGAGSTFRFNVLVQDFSGGRMVGGPVPALARPAPLHILCAEDNPYGRVVLNTILTELGHRTDFVGSGEAAVEAASRGGYDAVLMDVTLSGMDGLEATRRIRALPHPAGAVPIVGISGRANAADEAAARAAGMNAYLAKPVSPSALSRVLSPAPAAP